MIKGELLNKMFNNQNKLSITMTWYFIFYLGFIMSVWYFLGKAIISTYNPILAGFIWVLTILSYGMSIFLIRKEE